MARPNKSTAEVLKAIESRAGLETGVKDIQELTGYSFVTIRGALGQLLAQEDISVDNSSRPFTYSVKVA